MKLNMAIHKCFKKMSSELVACGINPLSEITMSIVKGDPVSPDLQAFRGHDNLKPQYFTPLFLFKRNSIISNYLPNKKRILIRNYFSRTRVFFAKSNLST
jgi:hypothetical protein